jgi:nitroimidazol reductase NimA-like FMN-containing flavoprotein (pyridoxamine 5'-phosphate oxidase superfamily)
VNFVVVDGMIFFHGARGGEKFELFRKKPLVSFTAVIALSIIPAQWVGDENCETNQLYKSVTVYGGGGIISGVEEKRRALAALNNKYTGRHDYPRDTAGGDISDKALEKTAVFRVNPQNYSIKLNLGQAYGTGTLERIIGKLEERNRHPDMQTASELKKQLTC